MQTFYFDSVDSTNEVAKRLVADGSIRDCAYILAREQSVGKGTRGRRWVSPRDSGVYLSVVHTSGFAEIPTTAHYALSAGVACVEALREWVGLKVHIKPVNDLWVDGRKLGGILTEGVVVQGKTIALVTGVGINVRRAERPIEPPSPEAVSLEQLLQPEQFEWFEIGSFVESLADKINHWHQTVMDGRAALVEAQWRRQVLPGLENRLPGHDSATVPIHHGER